MKLSDIVIAVFLLTSVIRVAKSPVFDRTIRCFATRSCWQFQLKPNRSSFHFNIS